MTDTTQQITAPALSTRVANALEFIVKIVVIGVPVLYALGRIYLESYWQALHLPSSLMHNATEDYLYFGFVAVVEGLARGLGFAPYTALGYAALVAMAVAVLSFVALLIDRWLGPMARAQLARVDRRIAALKDSKHVDGIRSALIGAVVWGALTSFVMLLFMAVLLVFLPIVFAANAGKRKANTDINEQMQHQTQQGRATPVSIAHYSNDGVPMAAPLLDCAETWCVVFDQGAFVAIPRSNVVRIDHERVRTTGN